MKKFSYFCLLALMALMTSCTGKSVSGRAYEVLVVVDQQVWERPAGRALFNVLDTDVPGLPQSERSFRIMNAAPQHYDGTLKLLRGIDCRINLIRFHAIPNVDLQGVEMDQMIAFRDYLTQHGLFTTIRASRGEDIFAACGMLSTAKQNSEV